MWFSGWLSRLWEEAFLNWNANLTISESIRADQPLGILSGERTQKNRKINAHCCRVSDRGRIHLFQVPPLNRRRERNDSDLFFPPLFDLTTANENRSALPGNLVWSLTFQVDKSYTSGRRAACFQGASANRISCSSFSLSRDPRERLWRPKRPWWVFLAGKDFNCLLDCDMQIEIRSWCSLHFVYCLIFKMQN